jgi:hypothetical protein
MPLTEERIAALEDKPIFATTRDVHALIAALRAAQAEARELRETTAALLAFLDGEALWFDSPEQVERMEGMLDRVRAALAATTAPAPAREGT